jgi:hypothetical protein
LIKHALGFDSGGKAIDRRFINPIAKYIDRVSLFVSR